MNKIPFVDLATQRARLSPQLDDAISRVLEQGKYILGPDVAQFEIALANLCGIENCVSCGNGTDALVLALMANNIGPNDVVIVPAMTFVATAEAISIVGATPFFCDVNPETFVVEKEQLKKAITSARDQDLEPRAVIIVDLFGLPAISSDTRQLAASESILLISDAAQSIGGMRDNKSVGALAPVTTTSFFPAKPLGCYGDGGAILTDDTEMAEKLKSLRVHGKGKDKYHSERVGVNSRLDTLQAAILSVKLTVFEDELAKRQRIAKRYTDGLSGKFRMQFIPVGAQSAWGYFTFMATARDELKARLNTAGVPTQVYYPVPLHQLRPYVDAPRTSEVLEVSEYMSMHSISLPMHPYLDEETQSQIIEVANGNRSNLDLR